MKIICKIILFIYSNELIGQNLHDSDSIPYILWREDRPLTYDDFTGVQDGAFLVYGYPANGAATTKIEISFDIDENGNVSFTVFNKFLMNKSWIKKKNPSVLSHEQGHFNISELYARKIRKTIVSLLRKNILDEETINQKIQLLLNELSICQEKYDSETHHGFNLKEQTAWERDIEKEMNLLILFK